MQQVDQVKRNLALEMNRLALSHDARQLGKRLPDVETPAKDRLSEVMIPVLVVVGEHDIPYALAAADYLVENIPSARKVILEHAAHLANRLVHDCALSVWQEVYQDYDDELLRRNLLRKSSRMC